MPKSLYKSVQSLLRPQISTVRTIERKFFYAFSTEKGGQGKSVITLESLS